MTEIEAMQRFTQLYDQHQRQVFGYAVSRAGRQAADEIVSDTFLVAWQRFADLPDPALPWLLGVARNVIREQFRQSARQESLAAELRSWTAPEPTGADPADVVGERDAVLGALAALSPDDRELLTLVAWHGLTAREAATVIGCSPATYFVRLHRARRRLEKALEPLSRTNPMSIVQPGPGNVPGPATATSPNPKAQPAASALTTPSAQTSRKDLAR